MIKIYNKKYGIVDNTCNSSQQYVQAFLCTQQAGITRHITTYQIKSLTLHTI